MSDGPGRVVMGLRGSPCTENCKSGISSAGAESFPHRRFPELRTANCFRKVPGQAGSDRDGTSKRSLVVILLPRVPTLRILRRTRVRIETQQDTTVVLAGQFADINEPERAEAFQVPVGAHCRVGMSSSQRRKVIADQLGPPLFDAFHAPCRPGRISR